MALNSSFAHGRALDQWWTCPRRVSGVWPSRARPPTAPRSPGSSLQWYARRHCRDFACVARRALPMAVVDAEPQTQPAEVFRIHAVLVVVLQALEAVGAVADARELGGRRGVGLLGHLWPVRCGCGSAAVAASVNQSLSCRRRLISQLLGLFGLLLCSLVSLQHASFAFCARAPKTRYTAHTASAIDYNHTSLAGRALQAAARDAAVRHHNKQTHRARRIHVTGCARCKDDARARHTHTSSPHRAHRKDSRRCDARTRLAPSGDRPRGRNAGTSAKWPTTARSPRTTPSRTTTTTTMKR